MWSARQAHVHLRRGGHPLWHPVRQDSLLRRLILSIVMIIDIDIDLDLDLDIILIIIIIIIIVKYHCHYQ